MPSEANRREQPILYEPDDRPPHTITFALGFQAAMLTIAGIVFTPSSWCGPRVRARCICLGRSLGRWSSAA